ncbi:MAG TPA: hypothetical protein PK537_09560 [Candidatus Limiplasma sp.]|nr:hypothetical protein [Candidatus Limiplasma sp.]
MIEVLAVVEAVVLAYAVTSLVSWGVKKLLDLWGSRSLPKQEQQVAMSEADMKEIEKSKEVIKECFGEDAVDTLRKSTNLERIDLMAKFADRLTKEYDLDIDVDITVNNVQNCGYYDWEHQKAVFNIVLLMVDGNNEHFDYCVKEVLDTIVHELRHAVQHKAIREPGYWNVDDERRMAWANNMAPGNYITSSSNLKRYSQQPIEADAAVFAALVMEGAC